MLSAIKQLKNQICNSLKNEKWTKRNEAREEVKEWVTDKCHLDAAAAACSALVSFGTAK